ncbi:MULTISPECIES: glycosyltransferase family 41 protein [unclassified Dyella]|uniref:O-linked N-acetylglucosamine transferase, SPINDLY family protein n=1 Tax=unclassified Dyella TaxID=2634549 RepID=UPI000C8504FB|nr:MULTISPECIES: glycosyltransferase family 41 protein [unclassified Dyella]MDR3446571.1 tetratricopeptide repeat protein [Dyella sp.]PMQ03894.1 Beta-barrel assembly-enhancing protease [Dyella sp. AD56]
MTDLFTPSSQVLAQQIVETIERGAYDDAERAAIEARGHHPDDAELARLHGITLMQLQRPADALEVLEHAARLAPQSVEVQCNLGAARLASGDADGAIEYLRAALRQSPGHPAILLTLGNALMAAARYQHARESYAMATHGAPTHPGLRLNLAAAELELGNVDQAQLHTDEALQLHPRFDAAYALRGRILQSLGKGAEATESWLLAERVSPQNPQYPFAVGQALEHDGQLATAATAYERALRLNPNDGRVLSQLLFLRRRLCDWHDLDELSQHVQDAVVAGAGTISPFIMLAEDVDAALQLRCAQDYAAAVEQRVAPLRKQLALSHAKPAPDDPIRIGFVADGFNDHATGLLVVAMFEALANDNDLDVHLFATTPDDGGSIRSRLATASTMHDVSALNHTQAAQRIHATGVEILFDLNGYSGRDNAELFALRPAPVQVNWLAFPGSMGAPWLDYLLADKVIIPDDQRSQVSEKLVRLPRCYQPNDNTRAVATPPSRTECGLPEEGTVFACFNNSYKINPAAFARLMFVLQQVPDSVLWLLSGPDGTDDRLRAAAGAAGIEPERLVFLPRLPHADYLSRYVHADLFLDTLPYNAHTTASDALWAGCPVLTCAGRTFAGRVATSLLLQLGLPELVCEDEEAFIAMATQLGNDREALRTLRQHLSQQRTQSSLFDMQGFAADFRRAVQAMSARHRIGRRPADVDL